MGEMRENETMRTNTDRRRALARMLGLGAGLGALGMVPPGVLAGPAAEPVLLGETNDAGSRTTTIKAVTESEEPALIVENGPVMGEWTALRTSGSIEVRDGSLRVDAGTAHLAAGAHGVGIWNDGPSASKGPAIGVDVPGWAISAEAGTDKLRGIALVAKGSLHLQPSAGRARIAAGKTSVDVTVPEGLISQKTLVLATLQTPGAVHVQSARPVRKNRIRITLSARAAAATVVAYLVLN